MQETLLYANAHRGKARKAVQNPLALQMVEEDLRHIPSKGWAAMIRKAYEVSPLLCPQCGGRIFFMIFSLPGRRGLGDFRRFWRLRTAQEHFPALSSRP